MPVLTPAMPAPAAAAVFSAPPQSPMARVLTTLAQRPAHRAYGLATTTVRPDGCGGRHCGHCQPLPGQDPTPPAAADHPANLTRQAARAELMRRYGATGALVAPRSASR